MPLDRRHYHEQTLKMLDASLQRDQEAREERAAAQKMQELNAIFAPLEAKQQRWKRNNEAWFAARPGYRRKHQRAW